VITVRHFNYIPAKLCCFFMLRHINPTSGYINLIWNRAWNYRAMSMVVW